MVWAKLLFIPSDNGTYNATFIVGILSEMSPGYSHHYGHKCPTHRNAYFPQSGTRRQPATVAFSHLVDAPADLKRDFTSALPSTPGTLPLLMRKANWPGGYIHLPG